MPATIAGAAGHVGEAWAECPVTTLRNEDAMCGYGRAALQTAPALLEWQHRLPLLLAEIAEADADIITLQEVNRFGA